LKDHSILVPLERSLVSLTFVPLPTSSSHFIIIDWLLVLARAGVTRALCYGLLAILILPAVLLLVPTLHPPRESAIVLRAGTGGAGRALPLGDAVRDSLALCGLLLVSTQACLTLAEVAKSLVAVEVSAVSIRGTVRLTEVT